VRGFRIYADRQKASGWQDSPGMKQMWNQAADSGQSMCLLANPDALPLVIAMCERFPKTRVVIDHFARIGVSGAINPVELDNLCRLSKFENVFVKTSAFYALGKKQSPYTDLGAMIQRLVGEFGANRLMWASDCPYQVVGGHHYADSIGLVRDNLDFLTKENKQWMLRGTAEKVFF
jgi:predicted TIM-barrel fold metal-dependent hydrolase